MLGYSIKCFSNHMTLAMLTCPFWVACSTPSSQSFAAAFLVGCIRERHASDELAGLVFFCFFCSPDERCWSLVPVALPGMPCWLTRRLGACVRACACECVHACVRVPALQNSLSLAVKRQNQLTSDGQHVDVAARVRRMSSSTCPSCCSTCCASAAEGAAP